MMQYSLGSSMSSSSQNNRPQQQSSPSDKSLSTATPPHQVSRASPASTALVMSSNNINGGLQSTSRQLTPNSSSNNGTGSSTSSTGNHHPSNQHGTAGPPNPMIRQFVCHAKSMSAGVVVPVPGISNHLASATGMNQNNIINTNITTNNHHNGPTGTTVTDGVQHHRSNSHHQQQVSNREYRNYHHRQVPHQNHQHQQQQLLHQHPSYDNNSHQTGDSNQFISARHANSSSIILGNNNINNVHNRSSSTQLSNIVLGHHQNAHSQSNSRNFPPQPPNPIWSIEENISKSHGKLSSSGFIPHPYLFNNSITDMSCDNVSNASRLLDGLPAPGYYLHASNNLPNSNALSASGSIKSPEFLPIRDLLFNLITMIIYFCENTFGIIALIALYYHSLTKYWALIGASFVLIANYTCQYLSFKWLYRSKLEDCRRKREAQEELEDEEACERRYYNRMAANMRNYQCGSCNWLPDSAMEMKLKFLVSVALDGLMHIFCLGFLVRYIKLVIPVTDAARVKKEARDLSMLRMIHGFIQSIPLLLLQTYMICSQTCSASITNLSVTSAILSLVSVCWALASFTKYARKKYMHKFVLTWLGIVSQFLWRLGTISSRVVALTIYSVYYGYWMLAILALHWVTMFFWLMKPGNLLRDEVNLSRTKKVSFAMGAAWIYSFCYMNFEEKNSKLKMLSYYLIMFLENNLLLTVCLISSSQVTWFKNLSILVVYLGFVVGMLFMFIYYKYFHLSTMNNGLSCSEESIDSIADQLSAAGKKIAGFKPGTLRLKSEDSLTSGHIYNSNISTTLHTGSQPEIGRTIKPPYLNLNQVPLLQSGVFDCKFDTGLKKQKMHERRQVQ